MVRALAASRSSIISRPRAEDDPRRRRPDLKARRLLGYEPRITLEEGLRRMMAWFARHAGLGPSASDERVTDAARA